MEIEADLKRNKNIQCEGGIDGIDTLTPVSTYVCIPYICCTYAYIYRDIWTVQSSFCLPSAVRCSTAFLPSSHLSRDVARV